MRIGQIARQINISPGEIIEFIQNQGFTTDIDTNARLDEQQIKAIFDHFAPKKANALDTLIASQPAQGTEMDAARDHTAGENSDAPVETIRAPKIELQGLRVVGKIELPEPKKKQPEPESTSQESVERRPEVFKRRDPKPNRPWINPLEKQRLREARLAEEEKKKNIARQKELRTAAYLSRQMKLKNTAVVRNKNVRNTGAPEQRKSKPRPQSLLGRIWHWLTNAE